MAYYLTIVPSDERNQTFHERYSFYKACFTLREAYVLNREKYCYCDKFEGPALASGSTLNCLVCKATVAWDFFDLNSIKDSISALKKLYLESEEFNFEMVMDNIPPFWIKDSYKEARQIDKETREINEVLPNLLKYIFLMRSQLICTNNAQCLQAKFQGPVTENSVSLCKFPICIFRKKWNMFDLKACKDDFEQMKLLYKSCVEVTVKLMLLGVDCYWLQNPESWLSDDELPQSESFEKQVLFCFRL